MKCPSCGTDVEGGRFCANCGAALEKPKCPSCGHNHQLEPDFVINAEPRWRFADRYPRFRKPGGVVDGRCSVARTDLGDRVTRYMAPGAPMRLHRWSPGRRQAPVPVGAPPDLSSMTPREAADRLFNRVMTAVSVDDSTEASTFLPMAIAAFALAEPLDTDGKFHVVLLNLTGQFNAEALEGAEEILSEQPNHLLGLAMAGDASLALGDSAGARRYYGRWLDAYESETAKDLLEYRDHAPMFSEMQVTAEALGGND